MSFFNTMYSNVKLMDDFIGKALRYQWTPFQLYQEIFNKVSFNGTQFGMESLITQALCKYSSILLKQYLSNINLPKGISLEGYSNDFYKINFFLKFKETSSREEIKLSVCYPTDACGNRVMDFQRGEQQMIIETALIGKDGLIYKKEWGYEDIRRFYSYEELRKEIYRLYEI